MIDTLYFVIRKGDQYLDHNSEWSTDRARAWRFTSRIVFADNNDGGSVYLVLPSGKEIEVTPEDFLLTEWLKS